MLEVRKTDTYVHWLDSLRDIKARARVLARVERLATGNPGDVSRLAKAYQKCGLTMVPGIVCITRCADGH